jgi:ribosomal protein L33
MIIKYPKIEVLCKWCGGKYTTKQDVIDCGRKFCTMSCYYESKGWKNKEEKLDIKNNK